MPGRERGQRLRRLLRFKFGEGRSRRRGGGLVIVLNMVHWALLRLWGRRVVPTNVVRNYELLTAMLPAYLRDEIMTARDDVLRKLAVVEISYFQCERCNLCVSLRPKWKR